MDTSTWLAQTTKRLEKAGIESARLDATVLLEDVSGKDRAWLLANPDFHIEDTGFHKLEELITRREKHEPLAYIREKSEFYGHEFYINNRVLVPRPESETMIEMLLQEAVAYEELRIIDVGTGSGALAISAKLALPHAQVIAIDTDKHCLAVAADNAAKHEVDIALLQGNLIEPLLSQDTEIPTIILANLPYVPNNYEINEAARHEPELALFGGEDGLDLYREMFTQTENLEYPPLLVLTEALATQHELLTDIASAHNYDQLDSKGLIQLFELFEQG